MQKEGSVPICMSISK